MKKRLGKGLLPQLVAVVGLAMLAPLALGLTIDYLFGTTPLGLLICAAIGIVVATIYHRAYHDQADGGAGPARTIGRQPG